MIEKIVSQEKIAYLAIFALRSVTTMAFSTTFSTVSLTLTSIGSTITVIFTCVSLFEIGIKLTCLNESNRWQWTHVVFSQCRKIWCCKIQKCCWKKTFLNNAIHGCNIISFFCISICKTNYFARKYLTLKKIMFAPIKQKANSKFYLSYLWLYSNSS